VPKGVGEESGGLAGTGTEVEDPAPAGASEETRQGPGRAGEESTRLDRPREGLDRRLAEHLRESGKIVKLESMQTRQEPLPARVNPTVVRYASCP
jgi:hypothetical protein